MAAGGSCSGRKRDKRSPCMHLSLSLSFCASGCCVKRQLQLQLEKVSFYLLGCVSTIVCRDVLLPCPPPPIPRLQLCVLVSRLRLGLCLCVALELALASSSTSSWSCLLAPPLADTTCFILSCYRLFARCSFCPTALAALPLLVPLSVVRYSSLSLSLSLALAACVSFIYDYLCTTCFVFIACRCR